MKLIQNWLCNKSSVMPINNFNLSPFGSHSLHQVFSAWVVDYNLVLWSFMVKSIGNCWNWNCAMNLVSIVCVFMKDCAMSIGKFYELECSICTTLWHFRPWRYVWVWCKSCHKGYQIGQASVCMGFILDSFIQYLF